jgi:hypothetical protein
MSFFVYILASRRNGTLYVGMTDDLTRRYFEHKSGVIPGFTKRYGVKMLVWSLDHANRRSCAKGRSSDGTGSGSSSLSSAAIRNGVILVPIFCRDRSPAG